MKLVIEDVKMPEGMGVFKDIFSKSFLREPQDAEAPAFLAVGYFKNQREPGGFMSGYATDAQSFYMQRIGVIPEFRGKRLYLKFWGKVIDHIQGHGFRYVLGTIRNDNPQPLIIAIKTGWKIHGFKVSTNGTQYLQVIKDLGG